MFSLSVINVEITVTLGIWSFIVKIVETGIILFSKLSHIYSLYISLLKIKAYIISKILTTEIYIVISEAYVFYFDVL